MFASTEIAALRIWSNNALARGWYAASVALRVAVVRARARCHATSDRYLRTPEGTMSGIRAGRHIHPHRAGKLRRLEPLPAPRSCSASVAPSPQLHILRSEVVTLVTPETAARELHSRNARHSSTAAHPHREPSCRSGAR